jgi:hypothetical protein
MSFVSSNNCSDFCFAGFDGANVLGSEKRSVWWIYFKRDLVITLESKKSYKQTYHPKRTQMKSNSSTTKKNQHSSHTAPTEQDNVSNVIRVF